jgi:two-component system, OmpR family, response regulator
MSGYDVLRSLRVGKVKTPVLILSGFAGIEDEVRALGVGADDYVTKPFQMEELLARLRGLIRRSSGQLTPELRSGSLVLDPRTSQVTLDGQPVKLTSHELRVLSYLMHHRGRVVSQSELTEHIYAQTFDRDSNTVEVFIARLRRKLGASIIETVRGLGYRIGTES